MEPPGRLPEGYYWSNDDDSSQSKNSTCSQWTACSPCLDFHSLEDDSGCLWCNVPKGGGQDGLCVSRSRAQDSCEIGELQATCREGVGWYVLVLTLSALLCCCCFLTMARRFAEVWHERRWLAAGGELVRPLLGGEEDSEEQAHEAVFRGSLSDGTAICWRCPVCGFDNRPRCKHCDLCGISSEFAEAYWKDKNAPMRKDGIAKRSGHNVEDDKLAPAPPPASSSSAASSSSKERAVPDHDDETLGSPSSRPGAESSLSGGGGGAKESEEESSSLLRGSGVPATLGSLQGGSSDGERGTCGNLGPNLGSSADSEAAGADRTHGPIVEAALPEKSSRIAPSALRRRGTLTERQKRARRRRVWQRVVGADGKLRWFQTLDSPAIANPPPTTGTSLASTPEGAANLSSAGSYQPPPETLATDTSRPDGSRAASAGGTGVAANAAAIFRYWTGSRLPRLGSTASTIGSGVGASSRGSRREPSDGQTYGEGAEAEAEAESLLSSAERGEGAMAPAPPAPAGGDLAGEPGGKGGAGLKGVPAEDSSALLPGTRKAGDEEQERRRSLSPVAIVRRDSFGDEAMMTKSPGYYATFLDGGGLATDEARDGDLVVQPNPLPPSATRKGPAAGEGSLTDSPGRTPPLVSGERGQAMAGSGTGPAARQAAGRAGAEGAARRREAVREEAASEEWISSTRANVARLCEIASKPFWQKHSWFLDQLRLLQAPHGAGMEAMRIEVHRKNLLEDSFAQVSAMNAGELRRWLRVQFVGEPGVDAGGLEREWFLLICRALFDPSTGLFLPQPGNGAFSINPSSGLANELHLEYFRFTGRVMGKLLMEHSVAPFHLSLPILKHLLGLPVSFSDLEFADAELYRNLRWLRANEGAGSLGLDFTVTLESFGVKEVVELLPGGKNILVTDENKEQYLQLRLKHHVLDGVHGQLWHLMRGFYDVIPSHLVSVFDYQELELLLCGIPEIDVSEWKRNSRYLGDYRRLGEEHPVIKWFWEVVDAFSEEEKARFLQFCTGTSRLPPHGFKALQSNDGSFRAFSLQSITKRDSAFPRAHTCFNKLDLPVYDNKKELEECLGLCICFELTGFTID